MDLTKAVLIRRNEKPDLHWSPPGGFAVEIFPHRGWIQETEFNNASDAAWDFARRSTFTIVGTINDWAEKIRENGFPCQEKEWCLRDMEEAKQHALKASNDAIELKVRTMAFDSVEIARQWHHEIGIALWKAVDGLQRYASACQSEKEKLYWKQQALWAAASQKQQSPFDEFPDLFEYPTRFFAQRHNMTTANVNAALGKLQKKVGSNLLRKENGQWVITERSIALKVDNHLRLNRRQRSPQGSKRALA